MNNIIFFLVSANFNLIDKIFYCNLNKSFKFFSLSLLIVCYKMTEKV